MKRIFRYLMLALFAGLFIFTGVYFVRKNQKSPEEYKAEKAYTTTIIKKTVATGSIVPKEEVSIKPAVSGIVEKLYVEPGNEVKIDQLIARIRIIPNQASLNQAESNAKSAQIALSEAQKDWNRQQELYKNKIISQQEYEQAQFRFQKAQESAESARKNLEIVREGAVKGSSTSTTLVRSTVNGMVLEVPVKEGGSVIERNNFNEGTTIATIADMGRMIFEGKVDESEVGRLKENMDLLLTIGALPGDTFNAVLEYIAPKGVLEEGAIKFQVKARVNLRKNQFIRAGYSATADIVLEKKENVLAVRESWLQFDKEQKPFVEVRSGNGYEKKYLKTGLSDGLQIQVLEGIDPEDEIKGELIDPKAKKDEKATTAKRGGRRRI